MCLDCKIWSKIEKIIDRVRSQPKNSKIGRDPKKKSGRDRPQVANQKKYPVATEATQDTIF
jgi:hypothetical protein